MSYKVKVKVEIDGETKEEEKEVIVKNPTGKIRADAAAYSNKIFNRLINEKNEYGEPAYMLRVNMEQCLSERGIWTDSIANRLVDVSQEIVAIEEKLYMGGMTKSEGRDFAIRLRDLRYEQLVILSNRNKYDENTVEGQAENEKFHYFITKCILFSDDIPVFEDVQAYKDDEELKDQLDEAIRYLGSLVSRFDPDFEKKLPENRFLLKYGFCNDELRYIDENGNYVDQDGKRVDEDGNYIDEEGNIVIPENITSKEIGEFVD